MNIEDFKNSLKHEEPPVVNIVLLSLWYDAKGNWDISHNIAQEIHSPAGSHMHAYLHRKEGDIFNAKYWYAQAGEIMPDSTVEKEWEYLVETYLNYK